MSIYYKGLIFALFGFLLGTGSSPLAHESFRRLESGENDSNSNEEVVNVCCQRESHFETIGIDLDSTQLRVDVGRCRQSCNALRSMQRSRFNRYLQRYPDVDPVKIFLALQSRATQNNSSSGEGEEQSLDLDGIDVSANWTSASSHSCLKAKCVPTHSRRELHFGVGGSRHEVEVIESCGCEKIMPASAECSRIQRQVRFHVDTPFETALDLGQCVGQCGQEGEKCRSVRNKTVHIQGPNGAQCLQAIEECSCNGECYRAKEFYKVYDFSNQTQSSPVLMMIDIGRCVGRTCSSQSSSELTSKCLFWSQSRRECVSHLYGGRTVPSPCAPTKTVTHFYTDRTGHRRSILSIMSCGCNSINN